MNDRYLFRAKQKNWKQLPKEMWWVEGYLYGIWERRYILWGMINDVPDMVEVDPSTICQCTGLTDKNGNKIWENDVTYMRCNRLSGYGNVIYENGCFWIDDKKRGRKYPFSNHDVKYRVDGNIFDNPELIHE